MSTFDVLQWLNTYLSYRNLVNGALQCICPIIIHACDVLEQMSLDLERDEVMGHTRVSLDLLGEGAQLVRLC